MAIPVTLGKLEKVNIRDVWTSEAYDFTPWLAEEVNIGLLGDAIGLELEVEAQEKDVGPFRADILCKDTATGNWVLIENQLERTDHSHMGQLITYAAGLKAVTIVWIASRFTDEHRAALDWLNEITDGDFNFFGLEVEVWRIGSSAPAPKFNLVSGPNDWTQDVTKGKKIVEGELTPARQMQLEFWTDFREYVLDKGSIIKPTKPLPQMWMNIAIGRTGFTLVPVVSTQDADAVGDDSHQLRAELVMFDEYGKSYFAQLAAKQAEIDAEFGTPLIWAETPGKKQSKIYVKRATNFDDRSKWPEYHEWLLNQLENLHKTFAKRVKQLVAQPIAENEPA